MARGIGAGPRRVYFARAVDGLARDQTIGSTLEVKQELEAVGLEMVDPLASEPDFPEDHVQQGRADRSQPYRMIVEHDLAVLKTCDAVLMDMTIPARNYIGCVCEMVYAYSWRIPCAVYTNSRETNRPWLRYHATGIFSTRSEAVAYLGDYFGSQEVHPG